MFSAARVCLPNARQARQQAVTQQNRKTEYDAEDVGIGEDQKQLFAEGVGRGVQKQRNGRYDGAHEREGDHMRGGLAQQHKRQQGPYDKEHGVKPVEQQGLFDRILPLGHCGKAGNMRCRHKQGGHNQMIHCYATFSSKNRAARRKRDCQPNIRTPAQSDICVKERAGKSFLSSSTTK